MNITKKIYCFFLLAVLTICPLLSKADNSFEKIITQNHLDSVWQISLSPEVLKNIQMIQNNNKYRIIFTESCERMRRDKDTIAALLKAKSMPNDLLAFPFTLSFYLNTPANWNINNPGGAGIWQLQPNIAKKYNLKVDDNNDDRLDIKLSTIAALNYLNDLHNQFKDWKLAILAYEIGEDKVASLVKQTGSKNVDVLVNAFEPEKYRQNVKNFVNAFDSILIMMHFEKCL